MQSRFIVHAALLASLFLIQHPDQVAAQNWTAPAGRDSWQKMAPDRRVPRPPIPSQPWTPETFFSFERFAELPQGTPRNQATVDALRQSLQNHAAAEDVDLISGAPQSDDLLGSDLLNDDFMQDPLHGLGPVETPNANQDTGKRDPHEDLWTEDCYPSAETCRACHPVQYEQWRCSSHAYAAVSPMFNRFEQAITEYSKGTVGSFCVRCHSPVQTQLKIPRATSVLDAPPVVREGITCIACHRINEHYWRSNGDRRIEPGNIHAPVYGGKGGAGVREAIANAESLKLKLSPDDKGPGQAIHLEGRFFQPLTKSDICVSCHQVAVHPGIWLEVVHAQYRSGPAAKRGVTCQQCHMGAIPGKPLGYDTDFVAHLGDKPFGEKRKQSNHMFWGPGYSIAHPGIFPHNPKAKQYTPREWLAFDYRAGWGTDDFESSVTDVMVFPKPWDTEDDRRDGRKIIDANLEKLAQKRAAAIQTMEAGLKIEGPFFDHDPEAGRQMSFSYRVCNVSEGHNLPTGSLGAQPQLWLNVALIDPDGCRVWESGYLDRHGDLADMHSVDVATHRVPRDRDLFNLQTKFLINNVRGTDREAALPFNFSVDQLVFLRPGAVPVSVLNHPPLIRMEAHSIPPLDSRMAKFTVPASALTKKGAYRLSVRMRNRTEPIYFMRQINSTPDMIHRMLENTLDLHPQSQTIWVR
ncbi:MAG: hypothetical protein KDB00_03045 [Planctomycetales bacterium]|nr:hypothetical protein [Planctomycetales bacterium]